MSTASRALILYDGDCPLCRKTARVVKRFDWLGRLTFVNFRDRASLPANAAHLDPGQLAAQMHVLTPGGTIHSGFRAVRWIAGRVPLLWPVYPLLFIPGVPRLGQQVYLWVARNRFRLVPCRNGVCNIPPKRS